MPDSDDARFGVTPVVVDARFNSFQTKELLLNRSRLADINQFAPPVFHKVPELPITPDGQLVSGVLYDSPSRDNLKYYLPEYILRIVNTQYTTRLKFRDVDGDPHGPIAFLNIELVAIAPEDHRFTLAEIEHEAVVRLGYQMNVSDSTPGPAIPSTGIDAFVGKWINVDAETRGMTRLVIKRKTDTAGTFRGFGSCHPQDCDWGKIPATFTGDVMSGVYRFGFKDTHVTVRRVGEYLHATVFDDYVETDHRSDRTVEYILRRKNRQPETAPEKPTLWMHIGTLEKVSQTVRRCQLPIHTKEEYDRLLQIMTDPDHNARLEIQCSATMGYRSWRQIFTGNVFEATKNKSVSMISVSPANLNAFMSVAGEENVETEAPGGRPSPGVERRTQLRIRPGSPVAFRPLTPAATLTQNTDPSLAGVMMRSSPVIGAELRRVSDEIERVVPQRDTVAQPVKKVKIRFPSRVVVDERGEPVITQREVSSVSTIEPFWFNLQTHAYMFDVPETPGARHVLLRRDVFVGNSSVTFYQDSILREQVYYEPQAFRLARTDVSPFAPDLLFAFNDVSEVGEGQGVEPDFRVRLAYRVLPQIDQRFLMQARQEFEPGVNFTALTPSVSTLVIRLPSDSDDSWIPVTRTEAGISFNEGILDEIELTSSQFTKVFSAFQSPTTVGLEGTVQATLLDGTSIDIPMQISLQENAGTLFDTVFAAVETPGRYNVTHTNRLESRVNIHRVDAVRLGGGAVAQPADLSLPMQVDPGNSAVITYHVTPPEAPVVSITPVLDTTIDVDYERLWPSITVNQGFVKRTFDVRVSIQPHFFSTTPVGMEPLTSVIVEFDSFVAVELTPAQPDITIPLRMPLLPVLLNQPDAAQTYHYRIINQHASGTGAISALIEGRGDLAVVPPR